MLGAALGYATTGSAAPALIKINMGTEPWIGYGPWWIAQKQGYFQKHGLNVNIVNFQTDADPRLGADRRPHRRLERADERDHPLRLDRQGAPQGA